MVVLGRPSGPRPQAVCLSVGLSVSMEEYEMAHVDSSLCNKELFELNEEFMEIETKNVGN